jgi:hypothetical protein
MLDEAFGPNTPFSATGFVTLSRLFYYLALQERTGTEFLMLDLLKSYMHTAEVPRYGYSQSILDIFDTEVRQKYLEHERRWLGGPAKKIEVPLLADSVIQTSERKGWSLGRTISWMREWHEVELYRAGMRELVDRVDAGDHAGIDRIIGELQKGIDSWGKRLGSRIRSKSIGLTVALPLLQPTIDVPLPNLPRRPGSKMLVLIDRLLREW